MDVAKIVQNIQELCHKRGVKPTVAARESGAGKDLITNMKTKGTQPSIEKIRLLAEYLQCNISDILGGEKEPATVSSGELDPEVIALLKRIECQGKMDEVKRYLRFQATPEEKQ